jgi:hypothetical protein
VSTSVPVSVNGIDGDNMLIRLRKARLRKTLYWRRTSCLPLLIKKKIVSKSNFRIVNKKRLSPKVIFVLMTTN